MVNTVKTQDYFEAKKDQGKLRWSLLPWEALKEVVKVLEFGVQKYQENTWQNVPNGRQRYLDAAFGHLILAQTELNDSESGLPHLAHCACCVLFALYLTKNTCDFSENR